MNGSLTSYYITKQYERWETEKLKNWRTWKLNIEEAMENGELRQGKKGQCE